jgi:hypothetical protein
MIGLLLSHIFLNLPNGLFPPVFEHIFVCSISACHKHCLSAICPVVIIWYWRRILSYLCTYHYNDSSRAACPSDNTRWEKASPWLCFHIGDVCFTNPRTAIFFLSFPIYQYTVGIYHSTLVCTKTIYRGKMVFSGLSIMQGRLRCSIQGRREWIKETFKMLTLCYTFLADNYKVANKKGKDIPVTGHGGS